MRPLAAAMRAVTADPPPTTLSLDDLITGQLRRRSRVRLLAVAGAVTLVAGTAPVVLGQAGPVWSPVAGPSEHPVAGPATTASPEGDRPADDARYGFTGRAAAVVERSLPDGYRMAGRPVEYWAAEFSLMWADLAGPDGRRTQLHVYRVVGGPGPTGDVCAQAPLDGTRFAGREQACEPLVVGGETFRVATCRDVLPATEDGYELTIVTRYGEGWTLHLWELPYPHPFSDLEPRLVDTPVFTARQLADLALDLNP